MPPYFGLGIWGLEGRLLGPRISVLLSLWSSAKLVDVVSFWKISWLVLKFVSEILRYIYTEQIQPLTAYYVLIRPYIYCVTNWSECGLLRTAGTVKFYCKYVEYFVWASCGDEQCQEVWWAWLKYKESFKYQMWERRRNSGKGRKWVRSRSSQVDVWEDRDGEKKSSSKGWRWGKVCN